MFLTKRSNGTYYIFYERNGKRTCISTRSKYKSEALKFLSNFEKELKDLSKNKFIPATIKEFMYIFFRHSEAVHSPNTTETYKVTFNMLLNYLGDIPLTNLTPQILDLYFQEQVRSVSVYVAQR